MARHPRPPSPSPPPAPPFEPDVGFDPVDEWLVDFDLDQAMASELAKSLGLSEEAALAVPDEMEPMACDIGLKALEDGGGCGLGVMPVKEEVVERKYELLGQLGASYDGGLEVKKEAVILTGGSGEQFGSGQLPVAGIGDLTVSEDVSEGVVDADMSTVATVDGEISTVAAVGSEISTAIDVDGEMNSEIPGKEEAEVVVGIKGDKESKEKESESSEDEEECEESGEASSSSDEEGEVQRTNKDEESSEASSSSDEELRMPKKHGVADMGALLEEGELMVGIDDDDDDDEPAKGLIKSKHEVEVLPPVPKIEVQLEPHHTTLPVGTISAIMGERVIVEGSAHHNPLNEGSILWITESRTPLGIVDELFGPVKNPYYLVRYNSAEEVPAGISAGSAVSFVAEFADHILNVNELCAKGYDESGNNDEPTDEPEFSDDEEEAEYKRSLRTAKRNTDRQLESKKFSGDKKRAQPRGAGFRKDIPPRNHDESVRGQGHQSQHRFHRPGTVPAVAESMERRPLGPPMSAPTMLPPVSMNSAMPSAVQLANQMGGCLINPSQQFLPQQSNVLWSGGLPSTSHPNMGVEGAALAANIMQNLLYGANQYQQFFQNPNFGDFPNGMPMPTPQFMPQGGMPANPMSFGGPLVNPPFGPASQLPMGQGNFGQPPHMAGDQGPPPEFPNAQGFGRLPSPHGEGDQPPMQFNCGQFNQGNSQGFGLLPSPHGDGDQPPTQFNSGQFNQGNSQEIGRLPSYGDGDQPPVQFSSGQFNQGNSSFRGRRPQQRGGWYSQGRGRSGRHSRGRGGGGQHRK